MHVSIGFIILGAVLSNASLSVGIYIRSREMLSDRHDILNMNPFPSSTTSHPRLLYSRRGPLCLLCPLVLLHSLFRVHVCLDLADYPRRVTRDDVKRRHILQSVSPNL